MNMSFMEFMQHLANGISLGSLYALIAIGYTMVYGILRLINFAHGDIFMLGAYLTYYAIVFTSIPWYIAFVLAAVITGLIGFLLERIAYRPLRDAQRITVLISAIGASFFLQNFATVVFGGRPKAFPIPQLFNKIVNLGGVSVNAVTFIIPAITIGLLIALNYIINKTKTGMAMRALSKDYDTARLMGIDVNKIISITFFIGSFLAAVGGIMWGIKYPQLMPLMGSMPGIKCFIAAVIGGIGNINGTVISAVVVTAAMEILRFLDSSINLGFIKIPGIPGMRMVIFSIILMLVVIIRKDRLLKEN